MSDQFPNDSDGDALRRLWNDGDKLTQPPDIDFSLLFPSQSAAEAFATQVRERGYEVFVTEYHSNAELPWDVRVVKHMVPTYEEIGAFEDKLEGAAAPLGGRNDGWGSFTVPEVH